MVTTMIARIKFMATLIVVLSTVGCASSSTKQIATDLGTEAAALAPLAEAPLLEVRNAQIRLSAEQAASQTAPSGWDEGTKEASIDRDDIALRVALLREIGRYGHSLAALASDGELERIDAAAKDLYGALGGINSTLGNIERKKMSTAKDPISADDLAILSTVVNVAGRWYFEHERLKAMRAITQQAGRLIPPAVDLLVEELSEKGSWALSYELSLTSTSKELYRRGILSTTQPADKRMLIEEATRLRSQAAGALTHFSAVTKALKKFDDGHKALKDALEAESTVTVRNATASVELLRAEVMRIKAYKAMLDAEKPTTSK